MWTESLEFQSFTLTDSDLLSPVQYTRRTNAQDDLNPGTVASSELVFETTHAVTQSSTFLYSVGSNVINRYVVTDVQKKNRKNPNALTVTAYDDLILFDTDITD